MKGSGIGGQAVMEGVMMKNGDLYAVAVRKGDGDIVVDTQNFKKTGGGLKIFDLPILRGVVAFIDSLRLGVGTLMYSASFFEDEEADAPGKKKKTPEQQKKTDTVIMTLSVILAVIMAVGIFMILPYFLSQLLKKVISSVVLLTLCEGLIRIVLFVGYIAAISCMKEIRRVFMYHGAEHKSINCIENGLELTVENVRKSSRRHKRCGTSFLLIVMLISVFFFMFIRVDSAWLRVVLRLLLVPVIAGISYEFIRFAGKTDSAFINALSKPGLALQGLTTSEPDDSMIEVAIASVEAVFDWRGFIAGFASVRDDRENNGEVDRDQDRSGKDNRKKHSKYEYKAGAAKAVPRNPAKPVDDNGVLESSDVVEKKIKAQLEAEKQFAKKAGKNSKNKPKGQNKPYNSNTPDKTAGKSDPDIHVNTDAPEKADISDKISKQDRPDNTGKTSGHNRPDNSGKVSGKDGQESSGKAAGQGGTEDRNKAKGQKKQNKQNKNDGTDTRQDLKPHDSDAADNSFKPETSQTDAAPQKQEKNHSPERTGTTAGMEREMARRRINVREVVPLEEEEDDEILRALDQFFVMKDDPEK